MTRFSMKLKSDFISSPVKQIVILSKIGFVP